MKKKYNGPERRKFLRLDFVAPFSFKVCKKKTISMLLKGYVSNISPAGLLCNIKQRVNKNDILWLTFDRDTLSICKDIEKRCFIYQNGIIGKVVRVVAKKAGVYNVGIQFITREEKKSFTYIHPSMQLVMEEPEEEEEKELLEEESPEDIVKDEVLEQGEDIDQQQFPRYENDEEEYNS
ncbi:MAG: PilZ domain-containing protein [Candidatus Omnitrophica bacterium]|nr:PilZ domain-containing protein [Candidatus Omnitrophota bacterium]